MKHLFTLLVMLLLTPQALAAEVVNVYAWGGEIPDAVVRDFERATGITVHLSTFDSNETLYSRLKASPSGMYDVIAPSAYFVERMRRQGMLAPLDKRLLPHLKNLDKHFLNPEYDPKNRYSLPFIWGTTGIFYNQHSISPPPEDWESLWDKRFKNRLMLLDDSREVFSMALLSLGFNPNDNNPEHLQNAYEKLLALVPNIRLFASENIQAIMIDEDADAGAAWNGDAWKAQTENKDIAFTYPKSGFVIWVDCLAIPANAHNRPEAHRFIDFLLRAKTSANVARISSQAITNLAGQKRLPPEIRNNPVVYPPEDVLVRGTFQRDLDDKTLALYNSLWQRLKLAF